MFSCHSPFPIHNKYKDFSCKRVIEYFFEPVSFVEAIEASICLPALKSFPLWFEVLLNSLNQYAIRLSMNRAVVQWSSNMESVRWRQPTRNQNCPSSVDIDMTSRPSRILQTSAHVHTNFLALRGVSGAKLTGPNVWGSSSQSGVFRTNDLSCVPEIFHYFL